MYAAKETHPCVESPAVDATVDATVPKRSVTLVSWNCRFHCSIMLYSARGGGAGESDGDPAQDRLYLKLVQWAHKRGGCTNTGEGVKDKKTSPWWDYTAG